MSVTVYDVTKRCACGAEWQGKSFHPAPAEGVVAGRCEACLALEDQRTAPLLNRGPREPRLADVDLTPPARTGETEGVADVMRRLEIVP